MPNDGADAHAEAFFPKPGGYRFWTLTIPPDCTPLSDPERLPAALIDFENKLPGVAASFDPSGSGMARADVIERVVVLSGEIQHELESGTCFTLKCGDSLIQIGTSHRWLNKSGLPCTMLVATVGARRIPRG